AALCRPEYLCGYGYVFQPRRDDRELERRNAPASRNEWPQTFSGLGRSCSRIRVLRGKLRENVEQERLSVRPARKDAPEQSPLIREQTMSVQAADDVPREEGDGNGLVLRPFGL